MLITPPTGRVQKQFRTFSTMTMDVLTLADWLKAHQITHVAMESIGVFWKPVFHLLEEQCKVILIHAQYMKAVPGRKTDEGQRADRRFAAPLIPMCWRTWLSGGCAKNFRNFRKLS